MIKVGSTLESKETGRKYRVKEITAKAVVIEGCSIGFPCVDRNLVTGICGCSHFIYPPKSWENGYRLSN
jgi:hypothetical protein